MLDRDIPTVYHIQTWVWKFVQVSWMKVAKPIDLKNQEKSQFEKETSPGGQCSSYWETSVIYLQPGIPWAIHNVLSDKFSIGTPLDWAAIVYQNHLKLPSLLKKNREI